MSGAEEYEDNNISNHAKLKHVSQWYRLPVDILEVIMSRLYYSDQVRLRAVCKNWAASQHKKRSLPWVLNIRRPLSNVLEYQLNEISGEQILVGRIDLINLLHTNYVNNINVLHISCKYGWLLFDIQHIDFLGRTFLFFCPLTKTSVILPRLAPLSYTLTTAFSCVPDSHNFVFLAVQNSPKHGSFSFSIFHYGGNKWSTTILEEKYFKWDSCNTVCIGESFYFVDSYREVASYDITNNGWKVLTDNYIDRDKMNSGWNVFEFNGELMLTDFDNLDDSYCCCVKRFDRSTNVWDLISNLGDCAIFATFDSLCISAVGEEEKTKGVLANKVYYLDNYYIHLYFSENGKNDNSMNGPQFEHHYLLAYAHVSKELKCCFNPIYTAENIGFRVCFGIKNVKLRVGHVYPIKYLV